MGALRWAVMGPTLLFHLGADGGLAQFCEHYADSFNRWWDDLGDPRLDEATVQRLIASLSESSPGDTAALASVRDAHLTAVVAAAHRHAR